MIHLSQSLFSSITNRCTAYTASRTNLQVLQFLGKRQGRNNNATVPKRFKSHHLSYIHAVGNKPLLGANIGYYIDRSAELFPDREAIVDVHRNIRANFKQYVHDIDQFATGLLSLQLNKGDRFGIWCPNRYEWLVAQLAAARAGLIMVPLNPNYQVPEMEYSLKKLEMRAILMQESFRTQKYYEMMTAVVPEIGQAKPGTNIKSAKHPYFDTLIMITDQDFPGAYKYKDVTTAGGNVEKQKLQELQSKIQCDDIATIVFTSGTTGSPKGAVLTHHCSTNSSQVMEKKLKHDVQIVRYCCPVPLFHIFACIIQTMNSLVSGQCIVLPSPGYDAGKTLKAIEDEKCTTLCAAPTMLVDFLKHPDLPQRDLSSLNRALVGGAPCPPTLRKDAMKKLHCKGFMVGYGSTEVSGGLCITFEDYGTEEERLHSSGWIYDYMECKIIDEKGNIVPVGTAGEICVRGYKVMQGYWKDEEKTKEVLTLDGWYKTGDLGVLSENGALYVTGRIRDMILRGGANVYPREIEDVLMTHPKIAEAQVVGIPDERLGEQVCAWIVLKSNQTLTDNELREFCKDKMTYYKIPYYIRFVTEMPKTLTGKVKKYEIKEEMIKMLGLK